MLSVPSTLCRRSSDSVVSCVVQNSIFTAALCFIIISLEKLWDWGSKIWSTINAGLYWQGWYVELSDAPVSRNSFGSCELTHAIFWCLVRWILRPSLWPPSSIFTFSLFLLFSIARPRRFGIFTYALFIQVSQKHRRKKIWFSIWNGDV